MFICTGSAMPIRKSDQGWFWGSKGPFPTKQKALQVAKAAYASGYKEEQQMENVAAYFVQCMFNSVKNTHILHLQATGPGSYATHVALGEFYPALDELTDTFAESYQGKYGIITGYTDEYELPTAPLQYLIGVSEEVDMCRAELPQDSELQNILDEIKSLCDQTIYKLRFLS